MKKARIGILISICVCCLAGCNTQMGRNLGGSEAETALSEFEITFAENRTSLAGYKEVFEDEIGKVKSGKYDNIRFTDCDILPLRDVEKVGIYQLSYPDKLDVDESIGIINQWLKDIDCEDIDLEKELRDASGQFERSAGEYPYHYPSVYEYYSDLESGHGFFINTNRCYIQMGADGIYSMSDGSITEYLKLDSFAALDALEVHTSQIVSKGNAGNKADEVWELTDGEMAVSEAVKVAKDYFEAGTPKPPQTGVSVDIPEVAVFELGDKYGYALTVRRVYNGVPFAYAATGTRIYYSSGYEIMEDIKSAYLINHDTVAAFTGYLESERIDSLIEEQTDIISLEAATMLLDDFLAESVMLEVNKVELVYCTCQYKEGYKITYPCWQYEGINTRNERNMRFFVNVLSGEVYYYSYTE